MKQISLQSATGTALMKVLVILLQINEETVNHATHISNRVIFPPLKYSGYGYAVAVVDHSATSSPITFSNEEQANDLLGL